MPNNGSPTEGGSNGGKRFIMKTLGKSFKLLMVLIIVISIVLILLVSFLQVIWKAETADQMMDKKYVEDREKEIEKENE